VFDRSDERHYGYGERDDGHDHRPLSQALVGQKRSTLFDRPFNVSWSRRSIMLVRPRSPAQFRSDTGMMMAMKPRVVAAV
jgi:hypothetical protein